MPSRPRRRGTTPIAEWIVAGIGATIVVGVLGFLVLRVIDGHSRPPAITIEVAGVTPVGAGFLVEFAARNEGTESAHNAIIEGRLLIGEQEVERAEATLDYVPPRSVVHGGVYFGRDPRQHRIELRPVGYERP